MSIRPLPSDLQKIAENEVKEKPSRVSDDVKAIKEWMEKEPHLTGRTDDQWILTFLRGCKFRLQFTKDKINYYYSLRSIVPKYCINRDPFLPEMQYFLNRKIVVALDTNTAGPQTILVRLGNCDEKVAIPTIIKTCLMILEVLLNENDYMLIGQYLIMDLKNVDVSRVYEVSLSDVRHLISMQYAYPVRVKCVIFFNAPSLIIKIYDMFSYLLNEKIRNRVRFYNDDNLESLQQLVPRSLLPDLYGGEASWDELTGRWKQKLENYRDWFMNDDDKYGIDETKRIDKKYDFENIEGSFRKLDID